MVANQEAEPGESLLSRARSYAPVARSNSTNPFEQRISATRWKSDELKAKIATAPLFDFGPPSRELLDELIREYTAMTGDRVERPKKRDLVATCYRVHGPDFLPFVRDIFRSERRAQNLLGVIRNAPRRHLLDEFQTYVALAPTDDFVVGADDNLAHTALPCPATDCLPGLIYCLGHRPPFDPTSRRRYERHSSNPTRPPIFVGDVAR